MDGKDFWADVPSVDDPAPAGATTRAATSELHAGLRARRRTLFKTAGALGGALALNVLSWVPLSGSRPARATVGTEYGNCSVYSYDGIICVGAPYSRSYCGSDGWFLNYHDSVFSSGPVKACGPSGGQRNAWRWTHNGTPYRCADGYQQARGEPNSTFRICSWSNP
ncbi:hypothetical protein ACIBTV_05485 [Micromonospora sp. NPDC049366]|uniref:hypothetical protein n=1 Tax=Micromonospora sp. NPDC049366 TaxID=3364271 RepID=UPI003795364B